MYILLFKRVSTLAQIVNRTCSIELKLSRKIDPYVVEVRFVMLYYIR